MQDMTTQKILSRDFILCFFAQFAFWLVFCLLIPTIPIYLSRFGAKEAEIGFLIGIFIYPSLLIYAIENAGSAQGPAMATFTALGDLGAGIVQ